MMEVSHLSQEGLGSRQKVAPAESRRINPSFSAWNIKANILSCSQACWGTNLHHTKMLPEKKNFSSTLQQVLFYVLHTFEVMKNKHDSQDVLHTAVGHGILPLCVDSILSR